MYISKILVPLHTFNYFSMDIDTVAIGRIKVPFSIQIAYTRGGTYVNYLSPCVGKKTTMLLVVNLTLQNLFHNKLTIA